MIIGIGCDIVEHELTKSLNWESDISTLNRIFSKNELEIYFSKKELKFLTGRFAAKEAIVKCLSTGMQDGIGLSDIQILPSESGKPKVVLLGEVKIIADSLKISSWHITITHSNLCSMAFVIAESQNLE